MLIFFSVFCLCCLHILSCVLYCSRSILLRFLYILVLRFLCCSLRFLHWNLMCFLLGINMMSVKKIMGARFACGGLPARVDFDHHFCVVRPTGVEKYKFRRVVPTLCFSAVVFSLSDARSLFQSSVIFFLETAAVVYFIISENCFCCFFELM